MSEMVNHIASLFGEIQAGNNPVNYIKMNSIDAKALISELGLRHNDSQLGFLLWGASLIVDETLLSGTAVIDKLGKRMIY